MLQASEHRVVVDDGRRTSALLLQPDEPEIVYVFAHGAGAGMRHPNLDRRARDLAQRGIATLRYQFPYMEAGSRRPDWPPILHRTVRAAVDLASELLPEVPRFAGGHSFGGRMTSQAAAGKPLDVEGIVFFSFPLHPPKKPGIERAEHLDDVEQPMLFVSGDRDALARLDLLEPTIARLPTATLHLVTGGDHSLAVLKRSGRTTDEVDAEVADVVANWCQRTASA